MSLRGGVHQFMLDVKSSFGNQLFEIEHELGYHAGIQMDYFLNFNENKWALTTEPMIHSLIASQSQRLYSIAIDYFSVEFPIDIRHYFYITDKSLLLLTLCVYQLYGSDGDSKVLHSTCGEFEIGYRWKLLMAFNVGLCVTRKG